MELIYIWTKHSIIDGIDKEFTFSSKLQIKYEETKNELTISSFNNNYINIFEKNSILNVNSIVGENGVGKTTLLKFLENMRKLHITNKEVNVDDNDNNEYIAVYLNINKEIIIVNYTKDSIKINGQNMNKYSSKKYLSGELTDNEIELCSHIYMTESEYYKDNNLKIGQDIDKFDLTNMSIRIFCRDFYFEKGTLDDSQGSIEMTRFNILQSIFTDVISSARFQSLLDIDFYGYVDKENIKFSGKKVDKVILKIENISRMLDYAVLKDSSYFINSIYGKEIKKLISTLEDLESLFKKYNEENNLKCEFLDVLLINMLGELTFSRGNYIIENFDITYLKNILDKEVILDLFKDDNLDSAKKEKEYFLTAIEEIYHFKKLLKSKKRNFQYNADTKSYEVSLDVLSQYLYELRKKKYSFILKYISVENLQMSSGERALLNMLSRLYFLSKINDYYTSNLYNLHKNVLLLIDEVDLYLHPEWQRKIIFNIVEELSNCFPLYSFQIIVSTHSPIVLSDIPTQNSIFLKRTDEGIDSIKVKTETFSSSIYNLYRDAFFLENGSAIGEYAKTYINNIAKMIRDSKIISDKEKNNIKKKINLIGEPIIKKQLEKILKKKNIQVTPMLSNQKKDLICFLEKQKNELEIQIMKLKEEEND